MNKPYVSEFTQFMDRFLAEHPDVVRDQARGWHMFWDKQVDPIALREAVEDSIPFDAYEFDPSARPFRPNNPVH